MTYKTTDISDALGDAAIIVAPGFRHYGARILFHGPISTIRCFEDNSMVRDALEAPGDGRVLVVDGAASMRCALLGDQLAALGSANGWSGVIVNGCVRDVADLAEIELGVMALATHPRKSVKRGEGDRDVALQFANTEFQSGWYLYADHDGIVVTSDPVTPS
jgi:regulator of ribonuclease activity A